MSSELSDDPLFTSDSAIRSKLPFQNKYLKNNNAAVWKVKIHHFNKDLCPSGELNWHVHQYEGEGIRTVAEGEADPSSSAPACGGTVTGGHYDPTFACGGASQNNAGAGPPDADGNPTTGGVCAILRDAEQTFPASSAETGKVKTSTAASYAAACNGTPETQSVWEIEGQQKKNLNVPRSVDDADRYPQRSVVGPSLLLPKKRKGGRRADRVSRAPISNR